MELVFNIIKGVMIGCQRDPRRIRAGTMAVSFGIYDRADQQHFRASQSM